MKNKSDVFDLLKSILVEDFELDEDSIQLDANLYEDLDLDSIDAVDLIVKLREITGMKIDPNVFKQVRSVNDVVESLHSLMLAA